MARIVPSTIRQFIQDEPALTNCTDHDPKKQPQLGHLQAFELSALLHLLDAMPEDLMPTDPDRYMDLVLGMNAIRHAVEVWRSGDQKTILKPLKRWGGLNAVALVMKALSAAPDEAPAPTTKTLPSHAEAAPTPGRRLMAGPRWRATRPISFAGALAGLTADSR